MEWTLDKIRAFRAAMRSAEHRLASVTGDQNQVLMARALGDIAAAVNVLADLPEVVDGKLVDPDREYKLAMGQSPYP